MVYSAPSAGPDSVMVVTVTVNSITVQWEEVPCIHRNGEITGYTVVARTSGEVDIYANVSDVNARSATVSGLNSDTLYNVSVAAVNSAGTGQAVSIDVKTLGECVININFVVGCLICTYAKPM